MMETSCGLITYDQTQHDRGIMWIDHPGSLSGVHMKPVRGSRFKRAELIIVDNAYPIKVVHFLLKCLFSYRNAASWARVPHR